MRTAPSKLFDEGSRRLHWKNILAPTDLSEPSKLALKDAACFAEQCGAKITLFHVVQLPASFPVEASWNVNELINSARDSLDEISKEIPSELIREKVVKLSMRDTIHEIIEAAHDLSADLIVIATHGHNGLKGILLGHTAEKVVRHAPCPVLVVRRKVDFSEQSSLPVAGKLAEMQFHTTSK